jgi:ribokinase/sulfofructose kinase
MIVTGGEAARSLSLSDADIAYARDARAVFTSGYVPDRAVAPLVAARSEDDLPPLAFDLAGPLAELESRGTTPATIDAAVGTADLFVADTVALRSYLAHHGAPFGPRETERVVGWFRERGAERVALTRGAEGAVLFTPETVVEVPAYDVDVVDATGAGDSFVAGLIDGWLIDGSDPAEAGRHAAAVAALNCTGDGARGGLPTREAVTRFRAEREP